MKTQISRDGHHKAKRYSAVYQQQGRAVLDSDVNEFADIVTQEARLFMTNAFGFRNLAFEEMRKYNKKYFIGLAQNMVQAIDPKGFTEYTKPGIRAQLLDKKTRKLILDFVIEGDQHSTHILNAVSPAFTCAFPFAEYVTQNHILQ